MNRTPTRDRLGYKSFYRRNLPHIAPLELNNTPASLSSIMHSLKRNTAKRANQILSRSGAFWEHESFDHYIRNRAEGKRIIKYVLQNPVKAGLVKAWEEWPWNYVRE